MTIISLAYHNLKITGLINIYIIWS